MITVFTDNGPVFINELSVAFVSYNVEARTAQIFHPNGTVSPGTIHNVRAVSYTSGTACLNFDEAHPQG